VGDRKADPVGQEPPDAFLVAFGFSAVAVAGLVPVSSAFDVVMLILLFAVITAATTWITPVRHERKRIVQELMGR
jgi:hypothetical protein